MVMALGYIHPLLMEKWMVVGMAIRAAYERTGLA